MRSGSSLPAALAALIASSAFAQVEGNAAATSANTNAATYLYISSSPKVRAV